MKKFYEGLNPKKEEEGTADTATTTEPSATTEATA
jgi:hypothetical protein